MRAGTKACGSRFLCGVVALGVAAACLAGCGQAPAAGGTTGGDSQAEAGSGTSSDTGGTEMNKQEVLEALRGTFSTDFSEYVADAHGVRMRPGSEYYSADLTVIEEANEFVDRVQNGGTLPLFTSCCPAWVQFVEKKHPDLIDHVSTCRSPMSMFSAVIKAHFRENLPAGKKKHYHVALMPCTAKKFECKRDEFKTVYGPATDDVITTQELIRMIHESGIVFDELEPESVDLPFGTMSGAAIIFGVTGGVTEAVLRKVSTDNSRTTLRQIAYTGVRGMEEVKEATIPFGDRELKIAVVSGLANADNLMQKIKSGEAQYDLVEVMACPGGCISGAGQPYISHRHREKRGEGLYRSDRVSTIKRSQDNPLMDQLYGGLLKGRVHELLHVHYGKH